MKIIDAIRNCSKKMAQAAVVTLVMVAGCKMENLNGDQVAGVWRSEKGGGVRGSIQPDNTGMTLSLDSSGRLTATSITPGFIQIDGMNRKQVLSGSGTWSLAHRDNLNYVRLRFTNIEGSAGRGLPYDTELLVQKSGSEIRLFYFEGDPDENRRIFLKRELEPR